MVKTYEVFTELMLAADKKTPELHLVAVKNHAIDISDLFPSYSTVYVKVFLAPVKTI